MDNDEALASALEKYSSAARSLSVPPEVLLVRLKDLFNEARAGAGKDPRPELLQQIVVRCLRAYFRPSRFRYRN
jgi:hypothetical protein